MATRKDLLKAQSFTSRRMVAAFVDRDPDDPTPPLRRVGMATFVSILLGIIILAGTALFGLIRPGGGDAWREEGVIISDTVAGMQFVYVGNKLVPMANVTSAHLQAAGDDPDGPPRVVNVKTETLKGTEQGPMMGIENAPRQLPAAEDMDVYPLRTCSSAPNTAGDRFLSIEFNADAAPESQMALVARASDGEEYMVLNGQAHRLWRKQGQTSPLVEDLPIVEPGNAWLSAIPVGQPLEPLEVPGMGGTPSKNMLNMSIGQLAKVEGAEGANRYYVQLDQGLSQISYLDMRLLVEAKGMPSARTISESELASARNDVVPDSATSGIPYEKPEGPGNYGTLQDVSVCATFTLENPDRVALSVDQQTPPMPAGHLKPYGNIVDLVEMEPLSGGLMKNANNPVDDAATFLIIDGKSYPIPDMASRKALGYGELTPAPVPPQLLSLIPPGLAANTNLSRDSIRQLEQ